MRRSLRVTAGLVVGCLSFSGALAANRFYVSNASLPVDSTGRTVIVRADVDQDTIAFSVSLQFDASKVRVTGVDPGEAISGLAPEFFDGQISNAAGTVSWGVALDISDPITKKIAPGTGREILQLTVDVIATTASATDVTLVNVPGDRPRLNVMTDVDGDSVSPPPTLQKGTLSLTVPQLPAIQTLLDNQGAPGKEFFIVGAFLDQPGLRVTVCGTQATIVDASATMVTVLAPACGTLGWAALELCTDSGCATRAEGFFYEEVVQGTEFIRGNANDDAAVDISDAVAILGDLFLGTGAQAPCRDALDTDDSGSLEITDAVYLLNYLFQGGLEIPPPYPAPGLDPTPDALPEC